MKVRTRVGAVFPRRWYIGAYSSILELLLRSSTTTCHKSRIQSIRAQLKNDSKYFFGSSNKLRNEIKKKKIIVTQNRSCASKKWKPIKCQWLSTPQTPLLHVTPHKQGCSPCTYRVSSTISWRDEAIFSTDICSVYNINRMFVPWSARRLFPIMSTEPCACFVQSPLHSPQFSKKKFSMFVENFEKRKKRKVRYFHSGPCRGRFYIFNGVQYALSIPWGTLRARSFS